jgi:hypothetical protein
VEVPTTRTAGARLREWGGVGLLFAALTFLVLWPQPARWLTHGHAHQDTLFNLWRLSWIAESLTTHPSQLLDPPIFHPATRVLAFSDAVLLQGLLATPLLAAGAPILPVGNAILLLGPWLSALAMYLLVRDLLAAVGLRESGMAEAHQPPRGGGPAVRPRSNMALSHPTRSEPGICWPALIAGTIFGLLPYRVEHLMHLELQWSQWMPLACWALHRTVASGRVRDGVLTAVFVLAQFLSCIYYGIFLVMTLVLVAPLLLLTRERATLARIARALVVGAVVCGPPLLAYATPYRSNQQELGNRTADDIRRWSATAGSFVSAPPDSRLYGWTAENGGPEGRLWSGVLALLLCASGLWSARRLVTTWMYGAMLVVAVLFALGSNTPAYRLALAVVPPLRGLRAPARFGMMVALALSVLSGIGAAWVVGRVPRGWRRHALGAAMLIVVAAEYASNVTSLHPWVQRVPIYAAWLRAQPPGVVLDLPIARANTLPLFEAEWAFYGRTHKHPMVNGYSGYFPRRYLNLLGAMIAFPRGDSLEALRQHDVRYIVVHEDRYEPADFLDFDARLRRTPALTLIGRIPDPDYPVTVFLLEP